MKRVCSIIGFVTIVVLLTSCTTAEPAVPTPLPTSTISSPTATTNGAMVGATPIPRSSAREIASPTIVPPVSLPDLVANGSKVGVTPAAILAKAAAVRNLEAKDNVPLSTLRREELQSYLVKSFEKENSKGELEKTKALWVMLDLMKEKDDLYDLWLSLLSEQVAGFYEPGSHSMKLIGGGGPLSTREELTLAHEYVHALQDQHFNIGARLEKVSHDGEKALALQALTEGDATLAKLSYADKYMSKADLASLQNDRSSFDSQKLRSAPLVLQVTLLFPYQIGTNFVASLFQSGGWAAVDKAYANPPTTSEQIIHPEKYLAGEGPQPVFLPDIASVLGDQWSQVDNGTIGEIGWLVYLANGLDPEEAGLAAVGWGGDHYVIFRSNSGKMALAVLSSWDSKDDADELLYALYDLQDAQVATKFTLDEDTRFAWTRNSTSGYASIKGQQVLLVITSDADTTQRASARFSGF